jgi:putative tryptophan/tyrosine transport system substrate-binding protein
MLFKKIGLVATVVLILLCLAATFAPAEDKNLNIALILWRGETDVEKGFRDGLKNLGYTATYTTINADQNLNKLSTLLKTFNPQDHQYIYTFGTSVSLKVKNDFQGVTPQIFTAVLYPVEAGLVQTMTRPGVNISGASNYIPIEEQLETAFRLLNFESLGVFYNPNEANSSESMRQLRNVSLKLGFSLKVYPVKPGSPKLDKYLNLLEKDIIDVDAVYLPSDSYIISESQNIANTLEKARIPGFAAAEESVKDGVLFGLTTSYYEIGKAAAAIVDQREKGKALSSIPVSLPGQTYLLINKTTAQALKFKPDPKLIGNARWIE